MNDLPDLTPFLKNPGLVAIICQEVIKHQENLADNHSQRESETQLREIARTIERLEKAGVKVPDPLRAEKAKLVTTLSVSEEAEQELNELMSALMDIVANWYGHSRFAPLNKDKVSDKQSTAPVTSGSVLREYIIRALKILGGSGRVNDVLNLMGEMLQGKLLPRDLEIRESTNVIVWQNNAQWERLRMRHESILKTNSPRGTWELDEEHL